MTSAEGKLTCTSSGFTRTNCSTVVLPGVGYIWGLVTTRPCCTCFSVTARLPQITDLPTHLAALANNTGLDAEGMILNHTLFPLYATFIPPKRRIDLFQAMLGSYWPTIGLSRASTALMKWPDWLRYCSVFLKIWRCVTVSLTGGVTVSS